MFQGPAVKFFGIILDPLKNCAFFPLETLTFFPEIQLCYDDEVGEKLGLEISMKRYQPQTTNLAPVR